MASQGVPSIGFGYYSRITNGASGPGCALTIFEGSFDILLILARGLAPFSVLDFSLLNPIGAFLIFFFFGGLIKGSLSETWKLFFLFTASRS